MIKSKEELKAFIKEDNSWYVLHNNKAGLIDRFISCPAVKIRRYLKYLRKQEYFINTANGNKLKGLIGLYYERKKNKIGINLGIEIHPNCFDSGLSIFHTGSIAVNHASRIGKNCKLHGANCIGNNGKDCGVPKIGDNVDIGYGAVVIGDITIADSITIGANAVVNRSFLEPGITIAGVPAKRIK